MLGLNPTSTFKTHYFSWNIDPTDEIKIKNEIKNQNEIKNLKSKT